MWPKAPRLALAPFRAFYGVNVPRLGDACTVVELALQPEPEGGGGGRVWLHCRFAPPPICGIPDLWGAVL